jgi:hypothetical protein
LTTSAHITSTRLPVYALLTVFVAVRSALVPFSHDEVATFYFYIQPGDFIPFFSHVDANGHFLTSAAGWLCFNLFGSSPFSLRLPSLAAFILLCYAVHRARALFTTRFAHIAFAASFVALYTFVAFFSLCRGYAISMACLVMALVYLFLFVRHRRHRHFGKFVLFMQLALAANLTLIPVAVTCSIVTLLVHVGTKTLTAPKVLAVYLPRQAWRPLLR